jgi:hypothetical protein
MKKFIIIFYEEKESGEIKSSIIPLKEDDDVDAIIKERISRMPYAKKGSLKVFRRELKGRVFPELYLDCLTLKDDELFFDRSYIIDLHGGIWNSDRTKLFEWLDIEFMKALEEDDKKKIEKIKMQKKFLRNLINFCLMKFSEALGNGLYSKRDEEGRPVYNVYGQDSVIETFGELSLSQQVHHRDLFNEKYSVKDMIEYTPFYNILEIEVIDKGSGYSKPPTIDFICKHGMVFPPTYKTVIENGCLKEVKVLTEGCGFVGDYDLTVSPPDLQPGIQAKVKAEIYNDIGRLLKAENFNYPSCRD